MDNSSWESNQGGAHLTQNPPSYSEKEQQPPVDGPAPPMGFLASPAMLQLSQTYYAPYGAVPSQHPITQPPGHTTLVIPVQPTHEPDYLAYSIFTMLCCCLPLGIAALVYSVQTRDANLIGDSLAAQQSSKMARIFAHTALGVGLVLCIYCIVLTAVGI